RLHPFATVASRRHGARTATAIVRLRLSEEEADGRSAFGAGFEVCRWQADGRQGIRCERAEDEAVSRGARQVESRGHDAPGRYFDGGEQESAIEFAQHRWAGTGEGERSASLSPDALHQRGVCAAGAREAAGFAEEVGHKAFARSRAGGRKEETGAAPAQN